MWKVNRQTRYEIIRELIKKVPKEELDKLVAISSFKGYQVTDDPEYRRLELIEYLDEMHEHYSEDFYDLIDKQYIQIYNDPNNEEEKTK